MILGFIHASFSERFATEEQDWHDQKHQSDIGNAQNGFIDSVQDERVQCETCDPEEYLNLVKWKIDLEMLERYSVLSGIEPVKPFDTKLI